MLLGLAAPYEFWPQYLNDGDSTRRSSEYTTRGKHIHGQLDECSALAMEDMNDERLTLVLSDMSKAIAEATKPRPRPKRITGDTPRVIRDAMLDGANGTIRDKAWQRLSETRDQDPKKRRIETGVQTWRITMRTIVRLYAFPSIHVVKGRHTPSSRHHGNENGGSLLETITCFDSPSWQTGSITFSLFACGIW